MKVLLRIKKAPRYYILKSQASLFGGMADTHPEKVTVHGKHKTFIATRHKKNGASKPAVPVWAIGVAYVHNTRQYGAIPMHGATEVEKKKAGVPPNYTNVYVPDNPDSPVDWKATSQTGKIQQHMSAKHSEKSIVEKHARGRAFTKELPELEKRWNQEIENNGKLVNEAMALRLIHKTGFRNGGENGHGKVPAFGASSLRSSHASVDGDVITFKFPGKGGHVQEQVVKDAVLAAHINKRQSNGNEKIFDTNASKVLNYLHSIDGEYIVHDFRTWNATETATQAVKRVTVESGYPKTKQELQKSIKIVAAAAAKKIGDTPSVALNYYIDPIVFTDWRTSVTKEE